MTVCGSGLLGWREEDHPLHQGETFLFVTLTAPGQQQHLDWRGNVCPCTPPGGVNLAEWNATSGKRWSRFMQQVRRELGVEVQYFKGVEVQKRGAVHFHSVIRIPKGRGGRGMKGRLRRIAIHHGFGHEVDAQAVPPEKVAGYIAKYATKACDERNDMPWCDRETGEVRHGEGRYRVWSSSRRWGASMGEVRRAQARWAAEKATPDGAGRPGCVAEGDALDHKASCSTSGLAPP